MDDNASLDDFLGGEASTADTESEVNDEDVEMQSATASDDEVTPAATTYAWDGDGAACEACGEVVERRWQQDGTLVCGSCKEW